METITKITSGAASLLLIISIVMGVNLIGQENVYACVDLNIALKCDKLSAVGKEGTQTRCYYSDEEGVTYKNCKSGWLEYKPIISKIEKVNDTTDGTLCKVIKGKNLIKECVTELNETYLYIVRF